MNRFPWWVYLIGGALLSGLIVWRTSEDLVLAGIVALSTFLGVGAPVAGVGYVRGRKTNGGPGVPPSIPPAVVLCLAFFVGGCSLIPPATSPSYYIAAAGGEVDCTGYDTASMAWTGVASAAGGLATAGISILPAIADYDDAVLGVTISDAVLAALATTAALLANESASRYTRCVSEAGP